MVVGFLHCPWLARLARSSVPCVVIGMWVLAVGCGLWVEQLVMGFDVLRSSASVAR